MAATSSPDLDRHRPALSRNWGWLLALGVLMLALGVIGFGMLITLTIASAIWFAALLMVAGIAQMIDAFRQRDWSGRIGHAAIGLLYLATGILVMLDPVVASVTLTLMIAVALVAVGILRVIAAFQVRTAPGWWVMLLAGLISIALGVMIFASWPASGLFVLGLFFAVELVTQGVSCIALALAVRAAPSASSRPVTPPAGSGSA